MEPIRLEYQRLREKPPRLHYAHPQLLHNHAVHIQGLPRDGRQHAQVMKALQRWCLDQFGPRGFRSGRDWNYWQNYFCFRHEVQAFAFKMRWDSATVF